MANVKEICGDIVIPASGKFIIPSTVTEIEAGAFRDCKELVEVVIPNSVQQICHCAFQGCSNLKRITIPASVEIIRAYAFKGCIPNSINVDPNNKLFYASAGCLISNSDNYMHYVDKVAGKDKCLIRGCQGISSIPDGVTTIEPYALAGLNFETISIPDSVKYIFEGAFEDCTSLKSLSLPKNISYIESKAFMGCTSLESINFPDSIKSIKQRSFEKCQSLAHVRLPKFFREINDVAKIFKDCNLRSIDVSPQNKHFVLESDCLLNKSKTKLILGCNKSIIPETVKEIGDWAFSGCADLMEIVIPNSVRKIGEGAFYGCSALEEINLPDSLKMISEEAFGSCYNLRSIETSARFKKEKISFEHNSFRGAPAAKERGLWNGQDHKAFFDEF